MPERTFGKSLPPLFSVDAREGWGQKRKRIKGFAAKGQKRKTKKGLWKMFQASLRASISFYGGAIVFIYKLCEFILKEKFQMILSSMKTVLMVAWREHGLELLPQATSQMAAHPPHTHTHFID